MKMETIAISRSVGNLSAKRNMSVAIANKIKEVGAVGMQSRFESASPRIADWPRRQPWETSRITICIRLKIRRGDGQV